MDHVRITVRYDEDYEYGYDHIDICNHSMQAVYTFWGSDSWRESRSYSLETQTTVIQPGEFQMYFRGHCYWFGYEEHKEINTYARMEVDYIKEVIILFDMGNEIFDVMPLPDDVHCLCERPLICNDSITLCGKCQTVQNGYSLDYLGIWVMDEFGDHWTKHFAIETTVKRLAFLGDEILLANRGNGCLFSYNLGTQTQKYLPVQMRTWIPGEESDKNVAVVYVESIVPLSVHNKHKTRDTCTSVYFSVLNYFAITLSMTDKTRYSYSVWAFPPNDVCLRIKNVMESLRAEFGGAEIEPHIPIVGSIRMTRDQVLSKFGSLKSEIMDSYKAKVLQVVTRKFYYQCLCLLIDSSRRNSEQLHEATRSCSWHFDMSIEHRPRLSLLYGYLREDESSRESQYFG